MGFVCGEAGRLDFSRVCGIGEGEGCERITVRQ